MSVYAIVLAFILLVPWVLLGIPFVGAAAISVQRIGRARRGWGVASAPRCHRSPGQGRYP
jgi:hypothetical protein